MNAEVAAETQWNALTAIIQAETAPGKRLEGVNYVGQAFPLWTQQPPSIGVQQKHVGFTMNASNRRLMTVEYWIILGMQSTDQTAQENMGSEDPTTITRSNVEDAMNILRPFAMALLAILFDGANYILKPPGGVDGTANVMIPTSLDYDWEIGPGQAPENWAYARITLSTEAYVNVPGAQQP